MIACVEYAAGAVIKDGVVLLRLPLERVREGTTVRYAGAGIAAWATRS